MREIVLLGAHADTPQKEITLTETILDWKKYNLPITYKANIIHIINI